MSKFFAFLSRMKYIDRWGLMRSSVKENIAEHSLEVAWVAHMLALLENKLGGANFDACKIGMMGAYHETSEVITGDLPTPIKYFSPEMASAYKRVEKVAENRILSTLPADLVEEITPLVRPSKAEKVIVKSADRVCAYIKCVEELSAHNPEFQNAHDTIERELRAMNSVSVNYFLDTFIPAFRLTLDELSMDEEN